MPPPDAINEAAVALLDDNKARDIVSIPLADKSSIADYMVIASGSSSRQLAAWAGHIEQKFKSLGIALLGIEGKSGGDWILIDAGDVVIHLFRDETRAIYQLEKMWGSDAGESHAEGDGATESVKISAEPGMAGSGKAG